MSLVLVRPMQRQRSGNCQKPDTSWIPKLWNKHGTSQDESVRSSEIFLLSLRLEARERPNLDYIRQLDQYYGKVVMSNFISMWFKKDFRSAVRSGNQTLSPWISSRRTTFFGSWNIKRRWRYYGTTRCGIFWMKYTLWITMMCFPRREKLIRWQDIYWLHFCQRRV